MHINGRNLTDHISYSKHVFAHRSDLIRQFTPHINNRAMYKPRLLPLSQRNLSKKLYPHSFRRFVTTPNFNILLTVVLASDHVRAIDDEKSESNKTGNPPLPWCMNTI